MVIDTSAVIAMIAQEEEASRMAGAVSRDPERKISVVSLVEAGIVLERRYGAPGSRELEMILRRLAIEIAPVAPQQGNIALMAYWRFGKGIHPAGLNFGDCFAYALARATGEPLLFKGGDFAQTDIAAVPY